MAKGKKMCKHKSVGRLGLMERVLGKPTIRCHNEKVTKEHQTMVNKNQVYCSRRLCPFYESK